MKKAYLFFALLLAGVANSFAQIDQQFLVAGENNSINMLEKAYGRNDYIGRDETGFYFSRIHNEKLRFYHVDNSGKEDLQGPGIKVTMESRKYKYIESVMLDGNLYVLSFSVPYEAKKYTVHAHAVNLKTLKDEGEPIIIGSGDITPKANDFAMYSVKIKLTPSGKKMFLFCPNIKRESADPLNVKITLFDSKLNPEYEHLAVYNKEEQERLSFIPHVIDETTFFLDILKSEKSGDTETLKSRELKHYGKQGLIKEIALDAEKVRYVAYLEMHTAGRNIMLTNFYYPKPKEGQYLKEVFPEGLINIIWDTEQNKIVEYIQIPFHKLGTKEPGAEELTKESLGMRELITHADGSFTVFAEVSSSKHIKKGDRSYVLKTYSDMHVLKFSEKGTLLWNKVIPKKQEYLLEQSDYGSFFAFEKGDNIVILYNDDKTKMPRFVTISKEGKLTEERAQNNELAAGDVIPRLSSKINDNYFFIYTFLKEKNAYRLIFYKK